jgi:hypothetical protein
MDFYLDETYTPKTETGKKIKQMVENGEHCDGNIFWLIDRLEVMNEALHTIQIISSTMKDNEHTNAIFTIADKTQLD